MTEEQTNDVTKWAIIGVFCVGLGLWFLKIWRRHKRCQKCGGKEIGIYYVPSKQQIGTKDKWGCCHKCRHRWLIDSGVDDALAYD